MELKKIQKDIWQNKLNKGFNTTDVNKEFCLLYGEIAEAYDAWKNRKDDLNEELADITITNNNVEVLDEEELENAYKNGFIDSSAYNIAIETKDKLLDEIKNHSNKYLNLDVKDLLDEI